MKRDEASPTPVEAAVSAASLSALQPTRLPLQYRCRGFTLTELAVTMGVLVLLVLLFTQLLNSSSTITSLGHKQMDADSQARQLLDRMAIDFAQMVKRPDVDYYLRSSVGIASDCGACGPEAGNDQAAFFSTVPGYYTVPTPTPVGSPIAASPVSLVSYRVNSDSTSSSYNKMERMGKALAWNGVSPGSTSNSSLIPVAFLPQTIGGPQPAAGNWPAAVSSSATDSSYEVIGPQVFRFEYYYLLNGQTAQVGAPTPTPTANPTIFSDTPWDTRPGIAHTNVSGMRDVTAVIVDIAVIDSKSRVLLTDAQIAGFNTPSDSQHFLVDYTSDMIPGQLRAEWQDKLNGLIDPNSPDFDSSLPRAAISGIRVYERYFYLNQ